MYIWFKGTGGRDSTNIFVSDYVQVGPANDTQVVSVAWKPINWTIYETGHYSIQACMDVNFYNPNPSFKSEETKKCIFYTSTEYYILTRWSGNRQRARQNENLNDTVAYKIRCQVVDRWGTGINNKSVTFSTNKGYFLENNSKIYETTTGTEQGIPGIASITLHCSDLSSPPDSFDYSITAACDSALPITFKVRCNDDRDSSRLDAPYCHKRLSYPDGAEIKGDNFADGTGEDPHSGSGNNYKDIKLEIDYDMNVVSYNQLDSILNYAKFALESAKEISSGPYLDCGSGIKVTINPAWGTYICPDSLDSIITCDYLAQTRNYKDHIHCLIATRQSGHPGRLGRAYAREYLPSFGDYSKRTFFIGQGSSGFGMQDSLDRCGAVIFAKRIKKICDSIEINFCEYAGMVLAHEVGHCIQMGHTDSDSFGKNFMEYISLGQYSQFRLDSFNFFNIKSLDDTRTKLGPQQTLVRAGLSTREQIGVNTIGFNYFDTQKGGKMALFAALIELNLLGTNPIPINIINRAVSLTGNVLTWCSPSRYFHGSDVIFNFETEDRIGIAWFEGTPQGNWSFNYVRFDTAGQILLDLRNFKIKKSYLGTFGVDWEDGIPQLEYIVGEEKKCYLIYSFYTEDGWNIGWVTIDSTGRMREDKIFDTKNIGRWFIGCPSSKFTFHLIAAHGIFGSDYSYIHPGLARSIPLPWGRKHFVTPNACIEINTDEMLLISFGSKHIYLQRVKGTGDLLPYDSLHIDSVTQTIWDVVSLPQFSELRYTDSVIWGLQSNDNSVRLILFDKDGRVIMPKETKKGKVLGIDEMPQDAKKFIKIRSGIIYYFGIDGKGNLYYWNSKEGERK
ncbi:MAG: hypothetical protein ABIL44_09540 [candidate division WOR-3 bacterium]